MPALAVFQKKEQSGAPFGAGSANNGASVDAVTGKIVLGNDVGGTLAQLLSNREIPQRGFSLLLSQLVTGAASTIGFNIQSVYNTTGNPTAFGITVDNTLAFGPTSKIIDFNTVGIPGARLSIPVMAARMFFEPDGIILNGQSGGTGGISLNGTIPTPNEILVSAGFTLNNTTTLIAPNVDAIQIIGGGGSQVDPPSGSMALVNVNGSFAPTSGTAIGALLAITGSITQSGGANGITRGLFINPAIMAAVDYRALEVANGRSIFGGTIAANDGSLPNGAGAWLLGTKVAAASVFDAAHYVEVSIGGVVVKLAVVT